MLSRHLVRFSARFVRADRLETPSFKNILLLTKALFVSSKILFVLQKNLSIWKRFLVRTATKIFSCVTILQLFFGAKFLFSLTGILRRDILFRERTF